MLTALSLINVLIIFILLLFIVLLFHVGRHSRSNLYLGYYFISQVIVLSAFTFGDLPDILYYLLISVQFSWGAFFYFFISSLLIRSFKIDAKKIWHFAPSLFMFIFCVFSFHPVLRQPIIRLFPNWEHYSSIVYSLVFNISILAYNAAAIYQYRFYKQQNVHIGKVHRIWINISLWGFVICSIAMQMYYYAYSLSKEKLFDWRIFGNGIFLLYFSVLFYVSIVNRTLTDKVIGKEKYKQTGLDAQEANRLLAQLESIMLRERPFTDSGLKLKTLARALNISERNLSQLVNEYLHQSFTDYVNSFRINYAKELLSEEANRDKTILWVLYETGFNSKSNFNITFKKLTGHTPAEYRKKAFSK